MPKTSIEWTEYSWPVINGCRRISLGCGKGRAGGCYAERLAASRLKHRDGYRGLAVWKENGPQWTGETRLVEKLIDAPLRMRTGRKIFVCDMGDLFYEGVPDAWIDQIWAVMLLAPQHTFQVLTKRADRMRAYLADPSVYTRILHAAERLRFRRPKLTGIGISNPATNPAAWIWLGVSAENQETADERIPELLATPAAVRWVSYEPALGPIDFKNIASAPNEIMLPLAGLTWGVRPHRLLRQHSKLDWIVVGGESGPGARPFQIEWARSTIAQCAEASVPCFVKQIGARPFADPDEPSWRRDVLDRKGGDMDEWPEDLRIRQFPEVRT